MGLIPAESDEIERFPVGSRVRGRIGGISSEGIGIFVPDNMKENSPLLFNCRDDQESGMTGWAVMAEDEEIKHWIFDHE